MIILKSDFQVTLLSAEPEIQYVALRNINLIVQKRPDILKQEMKVRVYYLLSLEKEGTPRKEFIVFQCFSAIEN